MGTKTPGLAQRPDEQGAVLAIRKAGNRTPKFCKALPGESYSLPMKLLCGRALSQVSSATFYFASEDRWISATCADRFIAAATAGPSNAASWCLRRSQSHRWHRIAGERCQLFDVLPAFQLISIRIQKTKAWCLNPSKLAGQCGRLALSYLRTLDVQRAGQDASESRQKSLHLTEWAACSTWTF